MSWATDRIHLSLSFFADGLLQIKTAWVECSPSAPLFKNSYLDGVPICDFCSDPLFKNSGLYAFLPLFSFHGSCIEISRQGTLRALLLGGLLVVRLPGAVF